MPAFDLPDTTGDGRDDLRLAQTRQGLEADVAGEVAKLRDDWSGQLFPDHPMTTLASRVTRSLVEAGFVLHDCVAALPTGGVCVTPSTRCGGVLVTWTTHDILAQDPTRAGHDLGVHEVMNYALADVLREFGWAVDGFGVASAHIVTGHDHTEPGAPQ